MDDQKAIREFLGDRPDSAQLRLWRRTLEERLKRLRADRAAAPPDAREQMEERVAELRRQIAALEQEELVTEFIEDAVRVTLAMGSAVEGEVEDTD